MEREDWEQWLALPITRHLFARLRKEKLALMEEDIDTLDDRQSILIKGKVRELDEILTLNDGEAYERLGFETVGK